MFSLHLPHYQILPTVQCHIYLLCTVYSISFAMISEKITVDNGFVRQKTHEKQRSKRTVAVETRTLQIGM
jgi:hypothetical protein